MAVYVGYGDPTSGETSSHSGWSDEGLYHCGTTTSRPYSNTWLSSDDTIHCHHLGPNQQARYVFVMVPEVTGVEDSKTLALINVNVFATIDGHYEPMDYNTPQCMTIKNGNFEARPCNE